MTEQEKYERLWAMPEYRTYSPAVEEAGRFLRHVKPRHGATVIDFGCGAGRGGLRLAMDGLQVTLLDFAANCLDPDLQQHVAASRGGPGSLAFMQADLVHLQPYEQPADYGFCVDVMEHIPLPHVDVVLDNILRCAKQTWFAISTVPDRCGALIGESLHLTVRPAWWWTGRLAELGSTARVWTEARRCTIYAGRVE